MRDIVIIGHKAKTSGDFSLNDLPGSAGRMDILCRCVSSALFLSFGMRRDVNVHLLLLGEPEPGKIIRFEGLHLRYLNPDERSSGSLIQKALQKTVTEKDIRSTPGVWVRNGDLNTLLASFEGRTLFYLREDGEDIRGLDREIRDPVFILGDHMGVTEEEEKQLLEAGAKIISVGPISLHSNHCITLLHNELDRAEAERGEIPGGEKLRAGE
ncbi:TPA: tRNA (pseudouridine(54)-N(1))-methyltransferase TrmY [Methanosarcina acetivorans]|uniref:tRNA (pseudouridine(54)-N(1))-methyltransferase n=2 Tax=Methanosarcina acetivorans TaxID=2214 RepID=TRMY_METAC|nr:tRNA (pseudouridine(54)-N(1))-methyltransferase TrmY [Methanosarcina acetivorans]Q8TQU1.2 RecName: Full=tRNA (pseudouridine(54)-N(1))-methyltransferase [Methanosarcina acetivorans C2A]HIH93575.1 tRNA (pseudouridine(54)-N(1))-methyltransferase TrmY [Methanosarcina acetivorans]